MVEGYDAVLVDIFPFRQVCSQDAVIHHIDESADTVPAFVIEPDLRRVQQPLIIHSLTNKINRRIKAYLTFYTLNCEKPSSLKELYTKLIHH